jgi:K+-transporting ATPase ATPase A chain
MYLGDQCAPLSILASAPILLRFSRSTPASEEGRYGLLALVVAITSVAIGLPRTLDAPVTAATVEGAQQTIELGPVVRQEAIQRLGFDGGGFFNVNTAHPLESPHALSNCLDIFAMLGVSAALVCASGHTG